MNDDWWAACNFIGTNYVDYKSNMIMYTLSSEIQLIVSATLTIPAIHGKLR